MKILLLCFALFASSFSQAETVSLNTGRWLFDRYRDVDLNDFDYTYSVYSLEYTQGMVELEDGSIWQVVDMRDESKSFFEKKGLVITALEAFSNWQTKDTIIFHKLKNRDSMLAYNVSRDILLDVIPIKGPQYPQLTISSIQNTSVMVDHYHWNDQTKSFINSPTMQYYTVMILSDGTVWQTNPSGPVVTWQVGDPIHMAKDTPYWSSNTHILMNFRPIKSASYADAKYYRLGAWRSS